MAATEDDTTTEVSNAANGTDNGPQFTATVGVGRLRTFISTITPVSNEAGIRITPDGFGVQRIGASNVMGVDADLSDRGFEALDVDVPGDIGLSLSKLDGILTKLSDDLVHLAYGPATDWYLSISTSRADYDAAVLDEPPESDIELPAPYSDRESVTVVHEAGEFADAVDMVEFAAKVGVDNDGNVDCGQLHYSADDEAFVVRASGDTDNASAEYERGELYDVHDSTVGGNSLTSSFTLEFVKKQLQPTEKDTKTSIQFGNESPAMVSYELGGCIAVESMIAPRIL